MTLDLNKILGQRRRRYTIAGKIEIFKCKYLVVKNTIVEYIKLVRLPGWGAYCIPAVFGALTTGNFTIHQIIILFIIGIFATIFGFVLNDYADVSIDKLSPDLLERPLVKGTIPIRSALIISIFAAVFHYLIVIFAMITTFFVISFSAMIVLTVAAILTVIYDLYGKRFIGSDLFVSAATALYCLFGALVVSETISGLTWIVVCVTFTQVLYLNAISGGLKDADHDYKLGVKNIALYLGVKVDKTLFVSTSFKALALTLELFSAIFMFIPIIYFSDFTYFFWTPILIAIMFAGVFITIIKTVQMTVFDRNRLRKLISLQAFLRYSVVPVLLLYQIGYPIGLFLIIFPFSWYVIFNQIIYGKAVQPKTL